MFSKEDFPYEGEVVSSANKSIIVIPMWPPSEGSFSLAIIALVLISSNPVAILRFTLTLPGSMDKMLTASSGTSSYSAILLRKFRSDASSKSSNCVSSVILMNTQLSFVSSTSSNNIDFGECIGESYSSSASF